MFKVTSFTPYPVDESAEGERIRLKVGPVGDCEPRTFVFEKLLPQPSEFAVVTLDRPLGMKPPLSRDVLTLLPCEHGQYRHACMALARSHRMDHCEKRSMFAATLKTTARNKCLFRITSAAHSVRMPPYLLAWRGLPRAWISKCRWQCICNVQG